MPLQRIEKEIALNSGMDLKASTELAPETSLRRVENLRWDAQGELRKRPRRATSATISAPSGSVYTDGGSKTLFKRGRDVCALTHDFGVVTVDPADNDALLYARRNVATSSSPDEVLRYSPRACRVSRRFIERTQFGGASEGIWQVASAVYEGVLVVAWVEITGPSLAGTLKAKALDLETGTVIAQVQSVSVGTVSLYTSIHAVPYYESGKLGVLVSYSTGTAAPFTISTLRYSYNSRDFVADSNLTTAARYGSHSLATNGTGLFFAFTSNAGANPLLAYYGTIAEMAAGTAFTHTASHSAGYCHIVHSGQYALILSTDGNAYAEVFSVPGGVITMFAAAVGESILGVTAAVESDGKCVAYFNAYGTGTPVTHRVRAAVVTFTTTTPVEGTNSVIPNAWASCDGFSYGDRAYGIFSLDLQLNRNTSLVVARYTESSATAGVARHDPVARVGHDRFFAAELGVTGGAHSVSVVGGKAYVVMTADRAPAEGDSSGLVLAQSLFVASIDFAAPAPAIEVDGAALLASGVVIEHDGDTPSEHAPLLRPRVAGVQPATPSAHLADITTVDFVAIYQWVDALGRLHRSAPSASVTVNTVTVASERLDVYVTIPPFTAYDGEVAGYLEPELYITADGGSTFFLAEAGAVGSGEKMPYTSIDARETCWVFEDVRPGDSGMAELYSTGEGGTELVPEPPPSFISMARIGDRVWGIDAEDRTRVWPSKPLVAGFGVEWSSNNVITLGDDGVAIVDVGGVPTVLGASGIHQIYGDGPDALGQGYFSPARRLPFEVSCIDPNVCMTPLGVVFRSRRGFCAFGAEGLIPLGLPIDPATLSPSTSDYAHARLAYDESASEIRLVDAHTGRYFVFNVLERKWSEWTQDEAEQNALDVITCDGRVWYLHLADGDITHIRREYGIDETDSTSRSTESWELQTPWLRLDGVAGFGRLWELHLKLKARSPGNPNDSIANVENLTVTVESRSARRTMSSSAAWTGAQLAALADGDEEPIWLRVRPKDQRATELRVTVTETCAERYSGSSPVALRLVMGVEGKAVRQAPGGAKKGAA